MARTKNFTREEVLEKALPVFWEKGFADASLQNLEEATGVNRSGLYSVFASKEDIFLQSLRYYLQVQDKKYLLATKPLGWENIASFLDQGACNLVGQKGCFSVNAMRELAILPQEAVGIVVESRAQLKASFAKNVAAEHPRMEVDTLAEMILVFFTGLSMERNLNPSKASYNRKLKNFMAVVRTL